MKTPLERQVLSPWDGVDYAVALKAQRELAGQGRCGWLLFCCPPTITRGRRGASADIRVSAAELKRLEVRVLDVDRGGQVTYHGPGQVIAFPFGPLQKHVGDPRGVRRFVDATRARLEAFVAGELARQRGAGEERELEAGVPDGTAGVWIRDRGRRQKIISIGLGFERDAIRHGIALNVQPLAAQFELINPCGEPGAAVGSIFRERRSLDEFEGVRKRLGEALVMA